MANQHARIRWNGEVPVAVGFDDPYYSLQGGLEETQHVFFGGNGLPARLVPGFHIAELGVGTGLNLLALASLVEDHGTRGIAYTGFEAYPLEADAIRTALAAFPSLSGLVDGFVDSWTRGQTFETSGLCATFVFGDARQTVPAWSGSADAWFLDGFAPARNPQMWTPALMRAVADHTRAGGTAATYTAAGDVRRALADAGFAVERRAGFGRKRHMTVARLE